MYEAFEFTAETGILKNEDYPSYYSQHKSQCNWNHGKQTFKNSSMFEFDGMTND